MTNPIRQVEAKSDDELARIAASDPDAFAVLYRRYAARVYRYLLSSIGNVQEAEDLTAQTFLDVIESLPAYQPRGRFAAWLFTIAHRRVTDSYRRYHVVFSLESIEDMPAAKDDPTAEMLHSEQVQEVDAILRSLNDLELDYLRLHYVAGLTYGQIAQVLGRSPAGVAMALHRLLRKMKAEWKVRNERE